MSGTITRWDPTSKFAHTWIINGQIASDLECSLAPAGEGTELTLIHTGLPNEMCGGSTPRWHAFTERLAAVFEGAEVPDWLTVFEQVAPKYV